MYDHRDPQLNLCGDALRIDFATPSPMSFDPTARGSLTLLIYPNYGDPSSLSDLPLADTTISPRTQKGCHRFPSIPARPRRATIPATLSLNSSKLRPALHSSNSREPSIFLTMMIHNSGMNLPISPTKTIRRSLTKPQLASSCSRTSRRKTRRTTQSG